MIVILNNGTSVQSIEFDTNWSPDPDVRDLLNDRTYKVADGVIELKIAGKWAVILTQK